MSSRSEQAYPSDSHDDCKPVSYPSCTEFSPPLSSPPVEEAGRPTTTVMIYLAGDNNLSEECVYALTEIKKARPTGLVRVLAEYDPADEFLPTQRYEIRLLGEHASRYPLAIDLIDQYPFKCKSPKNFYIRPPFGERRERKGEGGTGDPRMLFNFVAFCVDHFPKTDHYVLIVCGHGAGIYRDFLARDNRPDGYLTIYELRKALYWMNKKLTDKRGKPFKLDVFGTDVCLMSMAEVTYELREYVDIAIGCESYSPAAGWPYRQTIEKIYDESTKTFERFGATTWEGISEEIVREYVRFYSDYWLAGLSVTMSALRVQHVYELASRVGSLAHAMIAALEAEERENELAESSSSPPEPKRRRHWSFSDALVLAHWRAQSYNGELYVDLADFCDCLEEYAPSHIKKLCKELSDFIRNKLRILSCFWGRHYQYSYGVSIYFPWDSIVPYYGASIGFPANSYWASFLVKYIEVTRREPRDGALYPKFLEANRKEHRMGSDKMGSDKMGSDKGGNPIHSMRNPPIVFVPSSCIEDACREDVNREVQIRLMKDADKFPPDTAEREAAKEAQALDEFWDRSQDRMWQDSEADDVDRS